MPRTKKTKLSIPTDSFQIIKTYENGSVDVVFGIDNKLQNISSMPVDNEEELNMALENYGEAYMSGLELEKQFNSI